MMQTNAKVIHLLPPYLAQSKYSVWIQDNAPFIQSQIIITVLSMCNKWSRLSTETSDQWLGIASVDIEFCCKILT